MMNKSRSLLLLSVLAVLFAACEEGIIDNAILSQDYTEPEYAISVSPGELSFPAEGGEEDITLELTRSLSWTATTNDSWITLPTHSGDDSPTSVIHILVAGNTSLESRTGTITFKTRGKTATLTVRQEGVEPFLSTDVQTLTFPSDGGVQQVQISTNGNWTATTKSESAFSVSPASGTGEGTLTVTAAENETAVLRWETLTLTSGTLTVSITLLQQAKPDLNGHAYVDLALPSGLLWATCNVGATTPEEYGDYFAWGETAKKNSYTWANYKWSDGSMQSLTKYNNRNDYGIVDNLSELLLSDDAAVVNWGGCWRMPTYAEWEELCNTDNCTWTPINNNGHCEGYKVTSTRNGNSIFLPAAGLYTESGFDRAGLSGYFWASTLFSAPDQGCGLYFDDAGHPHAFSRYQGLSVRPVGKMTLHFSLSPTSVNFPAAGSSETLSITANQPWTATTSDIWLTLSADAGTGDATLDVTAEENTSITRRTGAVTFQTGATTYTVTISQEGATPTFNVSPESLSFTAEGGSASVTISSNQSWTATTSDAWFNISATVGEGNATLAVTAEGNSSIAERSGKVTFTAGENTYTVSITQKGEDPAFSITPTTISFTSSGGNQSVSVKSNQAWTVSFDVSWLSLSTVSGTGDATVSITAQANTSTDNRAGTVTFTSGGKTYTVTIIQDGVATHFEISPSTLSFTSSGGSKSVSVISNQPWTVSFDASWLKLSDNSGTSDATLSITTEENTSTSSRSGTVTFKAGGKTYTISVTQAGADPTFSVTPTTLSFTASAGSKSVSITSNTSWTASSDGSWLTLSKSAGEGNATLSLTVEENTSISSRTGIVTFKSSGKDYTVSVTQTGADPTFSVTPTTLSFVSSGGSQSITLKSNQTWTASSSVSWLTLSKTSGSGDATVSITAQANTSTDNRSGIVTFTAGGKTYSVSVYQEGVPTYFEITPTTLSFAASGGSKTISVMSNQPWTVSADASWLKLSDNSGTSDATLSITTEENTTTSSRSGTVTFSAGGNSYTVNVTQAGAVEKKPYLTFEALENTTFTFSTNALQYSVDGGATWITLPAGKASPTIQAGNRIMWKANGLSVIGFGSFSSTGKFNAEGNIMSLLYGDSFVGQTSLNDNSFLRLFNNSKIVNAGNLTLPAATLTTSCYSRMFQDCTSLTTPPKLPATTLADNCYQSMFQGCTSLRTVPELPATTLTTSCYQSMFSGCTSLITAPELPATTLAQSCYFSMFENCTSLTNAHKLPATILVEFCYTYMFHGCTSLTTAPELPATTLADHCYSGMFERCSSLTTAPELPATTLANDCYFSMFWGTNVLPDCTNIDFSSQSVVESGGLSGLFSGTKVTDSDLAIILPKDENNKYCLPVTSLSAYCYSFMFTQCASLTTAPELPATTLAEGCYQGMFWDCTALTSAPVLPATTLATYCYDSMFYGCTSLTTAPELPATTLDIDCYREMFHGCTSLTTAPELPATTLAEGCYQGMFAGCSKLNYIKCLATDISTWSTFAWVNGVSASGTFVKHASMKSWTTGNDGIPIGWSIQDGQNGPFFSVTPASLYFSSSGGNQSVTLNSNQTWTASSSISWLTLSKTSGMGDTEIDISAHSNTSTSSRSGIVTFTAGGKTYTISVTQKTKEHIEMIDGYECVDLGLPSGTLWATCNVGASAPEGYGNLYAWGETKTKTEQGKKDDYSENTYKFIANFTTTKIYTKYWTEGANARGGFGIVDNKLVLDAEDDAATVNWGESWRMPTIDDGFELENQCIWTWSLLNGVNGYKVESKVNDNFIFLPVPNGEGSGYWTSSLNEREPDHAWSLYFYSDGVGDCDCLRTAGYSVRPVCRP